MTHQNNMKRMALVVLVGALAAVFWYLDLERYFTLAYIKESQAQFQALYEQHTVLVLAGFFGIYVLVAALSLPGAAVLTLAGGGMFGFTTGLIVVSFASSIGATLACLVARYVLRDVIQNRFKDHLTHINHDMAREGAFYLFTMRLVPAIPFFVVNLVMGVTSIPLRTFYWVSQLGMLAGTAVFVNAGKELARIDSLSDILSPGLIISLVLLGVVPLITKRIVDRIRAAKLKKETSENSE